MSTTDQLDKVAATGRQRPATVVETAAPAKAGTTNGNRQRFLDACACRTVDHPPVWLMRQAGRALPEYRALKATHSFLELVQTPELATEVTLQPIRRFGFDAAILFSDILVVADALGQKVGFEEGRRPVLEPLKDGKDLARLKLDHVHERLAPVYETVGRIKQELSGGTALIGFAG